MWRGSVIGEDVGYLIGDCTVLEMEVDSMENLIEQTKSAAKRTKETLIGRKARLSGRKKS